MAKLILMRGLPGSGKSTKAQEILEKNGNGVRVNKDLLRKMLHFDKWTGYNESLTKAMEHAIVKECLIGGINVIVDDTNLNPRIVQSWKYLAKTLEQKFEIVEVNTPLADCILHDISRTDSVGSHVIIGMAMQYGLYPIPKKGIVICDIDGTLADVEHRRHFVAQEPKDHKSFNDAMFKDTLRTEILDKILKFKEEGYEIFLVSGRSEEYRKITEVWLSKMCKGYKFYSELFMRPARDYRQDTIVKKEIYDRYFQHFNIHKVIDDRPSVIRMWRELGLDVIDVGDGIEF